MRFIDLHHDFLAAGKRIILIAGLALRQGGLQMRSRDDPHAASDGLTGRKCDPCGHHFGRAELPVGSILMPADEGFVPHSLREPSSVPCKKIWPQDALDRFDDPRMNDNLMHPRQDKVGLREDTISLPWGHLFQTLAVAFRIFQILRQKPLGFLGLKDWHWA